MQLVYLLFNILYGNAPYPAYGMREIFIDHILVNADGLKDLGAFIGLNGTDAHLGCNLYNAVKNGVIVILHCRIVIFVQHMIVDQLPDGILCKIRIDGTGAIAQKRGKVMHLPGFSGLKDQGN